MNESKLDSTVLDDDVYIPGFNCKSQKSRSVNGRNGGGVCTNVRINLNYRTSNDLIKRDGRQEKSSEIFISREELKNLFISFFVHR